jgi:superoxide dismutase, Cu-Zn family
MRHTALVLLLAACSARTNESPPAARADFIDAGGKAVGSATLHASGEGVRVDVQVALPGTGARGFHVHQVGKCEPPFQSAGPHFNPGGRKHGTLNPDGSHAGDMANIPAGWTNRNLVRTTISNTTLDQLFDADGSALVIHADPDDYRTDPSGNSGARVACGIIRRN